MKKKTRFLTICFVLCALVAAFAIVPGSFAEDAQPTYETVMDSPYKELVEAPTAVEAAKVIETMSVYQYDVLCKALKEEVSVAPAEVTTEATEAPAVINGTPCPTTAEAKAAVEAMDEQQYAAFKERIEIEKLPTHQVEITPATEAAAEPAVEEPAAAPVAVAAQTAPVASLADDTVDSALPDAPVESEIIYPTVNFTDVAPFKDPVVGTAPQMMKAAVRAAEEPETSGLEISKTATANDDGTYTIQLEAYATGDKVISQETKDIPTDIVLVLDQSGSMGNDISVEESFVSYGERSNSSNYNDRNNNIWNATKNLWYKLENGSYVSVSVDRSGSTNNSYKYTYYYMNNGTRVNIGEPSTGSNTIFSTEFYKRTTTISRMEALTSALNNFVTAVNEKTLGEDKIQGTDDDIDHKIAVVGYASTYTAQYGNTEVFIGKNQYTYGQNAISQYQNAFQDMSTVNGQQNVADSIAALTANGSTYIQHGMEMANGILAANPVPAGEKRNRVVVVFTDGMPGYAAVGFETGVATAAITLANTTKTDYDATVYTVGIFDGADATSQGVEPSHDLGGTYSQAHIDAGNWFLQTVSSNNGEPKTPSYYLSAADSESLNKIFEQISENIVTGGSSTTLDESAVIKDIISPQFELPAGATAADIKLYTADYTGEDRWADREEFNGTIAVNGTDVSVSGFDYSENWCGTENINGTTTYRGKKLIIDFNVEAKDGFLGGNNVYTNTSAGVFENKDAEKPVMEFERPTVDVDVVTIEPSADDQNIYLTNKFNLNALKADIDSRINGTNNAYADVTYTVTDSTGNVIATYTVEKGRTTSDWEWAPGVDESPAEDVQYTVTCEINGGTDNISTGSDNANINVFKPELTFKDSEVYYGAAVPTDFSANLTDTKWKHGETVADASKMGAAPALSFDYTVDSTKVDSGKINTKNDVAVDAAVKIGETDVTADTKFIHTDCAVGTGCTWDVENPDGTPAFLLHVKTCQLTITKEGGVVGEPYVFRVFKDGDYYTSASITGNGSVTIYELPVGTYSIGEITEWSWRYNPAITPITGVALDGTPDKDTITCTNTANEKIYWLNGYSDVVANISGVSHASMALPDVFGLN